MWNTIRKAGLPAMAIALLALTGGCESEPNRAGRGGGDDATAPAGGLGTSQTINVELAQDEIRMPNTLRAGPVTFVVKNTSQQVHSFAIEGGRVDGEIGEPLAPGDTRSMVVDLRPGNYRVYCPITEQHGQNAMEVALIVTE
jgi:hypothetical protein